MPVQSFSSFEAFIDANRHARLRPMALGCDRGNWVLTHLMVNNLSVQWGQAGGKAVVEGTLPQRATGMRFARYRSICRADDEFTES